MLVRAQDLGCCCSRSIVPQHWATVHAIVPMQMEGVGSKTHDFIVALVRAWRGRTKKLNPTP